MTMTKKLNHLKYRILFMKLRAKKLWADRNHLLQAATLTAALWGDEWSDWLGVASRLDSKRTGKPESFLHKTRILCHLPLLWQSAYHQTAQGGEQSRRVVPDGFTGWAYLKDEHIFPKAKP